MCILLQFRGVSVVDTAQAAAVLNGDKLYIVTFFLQETPDLCGLCLRGRQLVRETKLLSDNSLPKKPPQFVDVSLSFNSNPRGCIEFRICEYPQDVTKLQMAKCARQEPLSDETGRKTMFHFEPNVISAELRLKVPRNVNCSACVLQLKYFDGKYCCHRYVNMPM